ncbi:hypothetical protein [Candidatus Acetatifactor stercoripullorum]|uniref:hypothetical protein n=1 Tax=Candidatus Acetatifactor stercoripullorum TaxID=2838414 RepID=UPI00298DC396|nr:hypothetical protein [Candidatus Acetatifactor stercoripullorum]
MLIRPCYRVLKSINYLCSQNESGTTSNLDIMVYFNQKTKRLDLNATIKQLFVDGYIEAHFSGAAITDIKPTYKGKHYTEYRWIAAKEVIIKSFLLPIVVALITTLITLAVNELFTALP